MRSRTFKIALVALALIVSASAAYYFKSMPESKRTGPSYRTGRIELGDVEDTVSSNGSLKAVGTVEVLTQVTGTLEKVLVDFNDRVRKNQPLAEINTDKMRIALKEKQAALDKARAQHEYDSVEYEKSRILRERSLISDSDLSTKKLALSTGKANLTQAEAAYEQARLDIEKYAVILSPIDGIVLDRSVDPGQTVVGSGSTNTRLFTLAENLDAMDIEAAVDELDISRVKPGQEVRFSVEAHPERKFSGSVRQIRVVPKTSSNVVSYTVIVRADNTDGALLPGMTATVEFMITQKKGVVLVPSAALRFAPSAEVQAAARRKAFEERIKDRPESERAALLKQYEERMKTGSAGGNSLLGGGVRIAAGGGMGGPGGAPPPGAGFGGQGVPGGANGGGRKTLWLLEDDGSVSLRAVAVGASDETNTEILGGEDLIGKNAIVRAQ